MFSGGLLGVACPHGSSPRRWAIDCLSRVPQVGWDGRRRSRLRIVSRCPIRGSFFFIIISALTYCFVFLFPSFLFIGISGSQSQLLSLLWCAKQSEILHRCRDVLSVVLNNNQLILASAPPHSAPPLGLCLVFILQKYFRKKNSLHRSRNKCPSYLKKVRLFEYKTVINPEFQIDLQCIRRQFNISCVCNETNLLFSTRKQQKRKKKKKK